MFVAEDDDSLMLREIGIQQFQAVFERAGVAGIPMQ